jgi:hypothetical protein
VDGREVCRRLHNPLAGRGGHDRALRRGGRVLRFVLGPVGAATATVAWAAPTIRLFAALRDD